MKKKVVINKNFLPYFILHYFPTREEMLSEYAKETKEKETVECYGLFSPVDIAVKNYNRDWILGNLWLCEESIKPEVLAHECLHIAQTYERIVYGFKLNYNCDKRHINQHDERLAYLLTDIMRATIVALQPVITYTIKIQEI